MTRNWNFLDATIILIDDNRENLLVATELLSFAGYSNLIAIQDANLATEAILTRHPDLVLLDLNMPDVSGYDILSELQNHHTASNFVPILAFTADNSDLARKKALDLGASDFISKPFDATELLLRVRNFLHMRMMHVKLQGQNAALELEVSKRTRDLERARTEAIECLARAGEFRDDMTGAHAKRVGDLAARIAQRLELPANDVEVLRMAAPLHDLGKISLPDSILLKQGSLTRDEYEEMKTHTLSASGIIGRCRSPILRMARKIALYHHERWDGTGYMRGLAGTDIPLECRIVSVADMYDALISERSYKPAWTHEAAVAEIASLSGKAFDPAIVDAFLAVCG